MKLISAEILNHLRRTLYGADVKLEFYRLTPLEGETKVYTVLRGFHFQRDKNSGQMIVWLSRNAVTINADTLLHVGAKLILITRDVSMSFRVVSVETLQQVDTGWMIMCDPILSSTDRTDG